MVTRALIGGSVRNDWRGAANAGLLRRRLGALDSKLGLGCWPASHAELRVPLSISRDRSRHCEP
jgi:hypothetical protein